MGFQNFALLSNNRIPNRFNQGFLMTLRILGRTSPFPQLNDVHIGFDGNIMRCLSAASDIQDMLHMTALPHNTGIQ